MSKALVNWTRTTLIEVADKDVYDRAEVDAILAQGTSFINGLRKAIEDRVYEQYGHADLSQPVINAIRDAVQVENERQFRLHPISADEALADIMSELLDDKDYISQNDVDTKIEEATCGFASVEDMNQAVEEVTGRISIVESSLAMQNEELRDRVTSLETLVIRLTSAVK